MEPTSSSHSNEAQASGEVKPAKLGALNWIILVFGMFFVPGAIVLLLEDLTLLFLGATPGQFIQESYLHFIELALAIWALRVGLSKFREVKSEKSYRNLLIIYGGIAVLLILLFLTSLVVSLNS